MIIGYIESGEVQIYSSVKEALDQWKPYAEDVISEVVLFYTLEGEYLKPLPAHKEKKWYQMNAGLESITLSSTDPKSEGQDSLIYLLEHEATVLKPNIHIASLEELVSKVRGIGE